MRRLLVQGLDLALLAAAALIGLFLRENLHLDPEKVADLTPFLVVSIVIGVPINIFFGLDFSLWRYSSMADYLRIVAAVTMTVGGATLFMFLVNRLEGVSRAVPLLQVLIASILIVGARVTYRLQSSRLSTPSLRPGALVSPHAGEPEGVLIVGLTDLSVLYLKCIETHAPERYRVGGIIAHGGQHVGRQLRQYQVFDGSMEIEAVLKAIEVHGVRTTRIVVAVSPSRLPSELLDQLREVPGRLGVRVEYLTASLGLESQQTPADVAPLPRSEASARTSIVRLDLFAMAF